MGRSVTMKFEVVENGLLVQLREGNRWGAKKWVMDFRRDDFSPFVSLGESGIIGEFVRTALFGPRPVKSAAPVPKTVTA